MNQEQEQYIVSARKYRPQNFSDLLGQDALVQTLTNAIKNNRIHHAYMLTGIRGVGKTTTARIIAKALNCTGMDGKGKETVNPCGVCENCKAITSDRHMDVMELDAASRTGVDDMREILEGVKYKPTTARYKIYIIDEVHMLSKSAFNALLKTLEEPPLHVKFIFATTEIRKVPVTILSRCQRFDLQRLTIDDLLKLFNKVIDGEKIKADNESLHLIAKASDGSARDGLSLLDQAISLGSGNIKIDTVKSMIGLADRNKVFDMFSNLLKGEIDKLLLNLAEQYKNGATPILLLQDMINLTHLLVKTKIVPNFINDASINLGEKEFCQKNVDAPIAILSRIWQMMIKGLSELAIAPTQIDALEMILIRIAYSSNLPTPNQILEDLKKNFKIREKEPEVVLIKKNDDGDVIEINTVDELLEILDIHKKMIIIYGIKNFITINEIRSGFMNVTYGDKTPNDFLLNFRKTIEEVTKKPWEIVSRKGILSNTIANQENAVDEDNKKNASELPLVQAILSEFKDAKITSAIKKNLEKIKINEENFETFEEEII